MSSDGSGKSSGLAGQGRLCARICLNVRRCSRQMVKMRYVSSRRCGKSPTWGKSPDGDEVSVWYDDSDLAPGEGGTHSGDGEETVDDLGRDFDPEIVRVLVLDRNPLGKEEDDGRTPFECTWEEVHMGEKSGQQRRGTKGGGGDAMGWPHQKTTAMPVEQTGSAVSGGRRKRGTG